MEKPNSTINKYFIAANVDIDKLIKLVPQGSVKKYLYISRAAQEKLQKGTSKLLKYHLKHCILDKCKHFFEKKDQIEIIETIKKYV